MIICSIRNTTDFCMFILYSMTLLDLHISLRKGFLCICFFLSRLLDLLCRQSCHLQIKTVLFLSSVYAFISLSCLISSARTSSSVLNSSGPRGHPRLVPSFRGTVFIFHYKYAVSCKVFLFWGAFFKEIEYFWVFLKILFIYF